MLLVAGGFGRRDLHGLDSRLVLGLRCLGPWEDCRSAWALKVGHEIGIGEGCQKAVVELADADGLWRLVAAKVAVVLALVHVLLVPDDERSQVGIVRPVEEEALGLHLCEFAAPLTLMNSFTTLSLAVQ